MKTPLSALIALTLATGFAAAAHAQDAEAGKKKAAMCIGCHGIPGYQASFPEIHKVPMISGQSDKYIVAALNAYKKGERKHPSMRAIAVSLSDQDMADLAAFYAANAGPSGAAAAGATPPAEVAALLTKGNCASCHGDNYSKPIDPSYPKLAGQHADYLYVALKAYQTEGNPQVGRGNAIMAGMAKPFSHAELKKMAGYLASLPSDLKTVPESRFR
ncbi:MAG: cytochrome c4 [Piscinibacter sp.]|uniref:c-type cytochrome n=1 Tax=Piscinibacter sp. TaxID=1903157 RepID=UPI0025883208|nr:c-type cytochrome [Piscinibacter sp.]MCW5666069.1 cytochrome c4 [Piscinibacter sp.]